ncbi:tetratricopeptide repeat protein 29 isoform X2 [Hyla sarda]|uniref:tetratricopeptide repeat protein 29 isoform X2 n=1 Tax=Hyla sarda TaxID=327740 RepID=UPI0024C37E2B|nr:tetratricopeptide repeat protein 29 isoform X2 [Hyla sarda]
MSILPPMQRQIPQGFPNLVQPRSLPTSPRKLQQNRIHLIRDRDVKDHHRQKNIKELSKEETAIYQNSFKHSICIEMLRQGYHKSFSELFTLIHKWNALRDAAGPGSAIWQQKPLEEQHEKLDQLQHFLTRAEAAQRSGYYEEVYKNQLALAQCFKKLDDQWLSDHFYECCFQTAKKIKIDGGRKEAEAHANLAVVAEEHGQLEKAVEHYEAFYHLTVGRIWKDETGRTHNSLACENLWRIYTLLSDKMLENKEWQQAIKTLIKALDMAREGCDKKMEGEAAYRLGLAHITSENPQIAMKYLTTYMEISKELEDNVGLGKAYKAMAKALESQGKIVESIKYLENFIEVAKTSKLGQSLAETCICLGDIFNARGNYEKACQYFSQAYETAVNLGEIPLIEEAQVHFGIAKAHQMMQTVSRHTEAADYVSMEYLLAWKKNRSDMFNDPAKVARQPPASVFVFAHENNLNKD